MTQPTMHDYVQEGGAKIKLAPKEQSRTVTSLHVVFSFFALIVLIGVTILLFVVISKDWVSRELSYVLLLISGMAVPACFKAVSLFITNGLQRDEENRFNNYVTNYQTINQIYAGHTETTSPALSVNASEEGQILGDLAGDASMALAKVRIEIERRLREIMLSSKSLAATETKNLQRSARQMLDTLAAQGVLPTDVSEALRYAITISNRAIHGEDVSYQEALKATKIHMDFTRWLEEEISPATIRKVLESSLPTTADLDAFILDHFPETYQRFSQGMTRTEKINILLVSNSREQVMERIRRNFPDKLRLAGTSMQVP